MTEQTDTTAPDAGSQGNDGSPDAATQKDPATLAAEAIASERKRAAGAEAARAAAEKKANDALARLAAIEAANRSAEDQKLTDVATLQAELAAERKRSAEKEAEVVSRVLDVKYPNARKELPEVTDEVRLAKFEAMLREDAVETPGETPTPRTTNPSRAASPAPTPPKEKSSQELLADMRAQFGGQSVADLFGSETPN